MTDTQELKSRTDRRWWPAIIVFVVLPLLACGGIASWWFGRNAVAQRELDERIGKLKDRGLPVDYATLEEFHRANTDDLQTAAWIEVVDTFNSLAADRAATNLPIVGTGPDVPPPTELWPEKAEVQAYLDSHRDALDHLQRIAQRGDSPVWTPIDFDSLDLLLSNVQGLRHAARMLALEHHVALHNGDSEADFAALNSLIGVSLISRGDPIMISQLVSIAIHGAAIGAIKDSAEVGHLDAAQIDVLIKRLEVFDDYATPFELSLAGERAFALPLFENPSQLADGGGLDYIEDPVVKWSTEAGARPIDALTFLALIKQLEAVPTDNLDGFVSSVDDWANRIDSRFQSAGYLERFDTALTGVTLPSWNGYAHALARQVMANRIAVLGLGIRKFEREKGRLPETLDELTEVDIDPSKLRPLGGRPYGYRQVHDGEAVLWGFAPWPSAGATSVPDDPPRLDGAAALENGPWVWRIKSKETLSR